MDCSCSEYDPNEERCSNFELDAEDVIESKKLYNKKKMRQGSIQNHRHTKTGTNQRCQWFRSNILPCLMVIKYEIQDRVSHRTVVVKSVF